MKRTKDEQLADLRTIAQRFAGFRAGTIPFSLRFVADGDNFWIEKSVEGVDTPIQCVI